MLLGCGKRLVTAASTLGILVWVRLVCGALRGFSSSCCHFGLGDEGREDERLPPPLLPEPEFQPELQLLMLCFVACRRCPACANPPTISAGISAKKREGVVALVCPQLVRWNEW